MRQRRNACGQVYVDGATGAALAETGLDATSVDAKVGCVEPRIRLTQCAW